MWCLLAVVCSRSSLQAFSRPESRGANWRTATAQELHALIPARAPVVSERIETEFRTASGITDGKGHAIAGVVLITAGYSAEGKYSHYFLSQVPLKEGEMLLPPGQYLLGWTRSPTHCASPSTWRKAARHWVQGGYAQPGHHARGVLSHLPTLGATPHSAGPLYVPVHDCAQLNPAIRC